MVHNLRSVRNKRICLHFWNFCQNVNTEGKQDQLKIFNGDLDKNSRTLERLRVNVWNLSVALQVEIGTVSSETYIDEVDFS